jgi:hypothetical protein
MRRIVNSMWPKEDVGFFIGHLILISFSHLQQHLLVETKLFYYYVFMGINFYLDVIIFYMRIIH